GTRPQWAADPFGRYEWRYWDGLQWTHYVADRGVASIDDRGVQSIDPVRATSHADARTSSPVEHRPPPPPDPAHQLAPASAPWPPPRVPDPSTRAVVATEAGRFGAPEWWRRLDRLKTALIVLFICTAASSLAIAGALANRFQVIDDLSKAPQATEK